MEFHAAEPVRVKPADDEVLRAFSKRQRRLAGFVSLRAGDCIALHHRPPMYLPEPLRVESLQQFPQGRPDQMLPLRRDD
jgi:hypothetical protein